MELAIVLAVLKSIGEYNEAGGYESSKIWIGYLFVLWKKDVHQR